MFLGRVVGDGEPLWLEDDRAWSIALQQVEADECAGCGQPRSETMATTHNERGNIIPAHMYEAETIRCAACRAKDQHLAEVEDHDGAFITVTKIR
ncbi:MAG: hypothetical protein ACRDLM_12345 [Gaiellaceae bacterium]